LKFSKFFAVFLVMILPLLVYFLNLGSFTMLVEISGGLFIGLEGILILAMWGRMKDEERIMNNKFGTGLIKRMPNVFVCGLYAVFGVSIVYVIVSRFL
jgi:hypothetical protein